MDMGLFLMPLHPPEKPPSVSIAEDLELIVHADKLGFTEAWVGEHMTAKWEIVGSPDLFLSHAFAITKDIRLGTGVYLLAVHHPSDVATRAALLDQISKGRFNFGIGTGSVPSDRPFKSVVDDARVMNGRFAESLEIILGIWQAEPPWKYEGEYWTVELTDKWADLDMGFPLKPFTRPHPPIAIPGFSRDSGSIFEAGKRGWGALSTNLASNDIIGTHQSRYKQGMELDGGVFRPQGWRVAREVHVADTDQEAMDYAINGPMGEAFRRYMLPLCKKNIPEGLGIFKNDPSIPDSDVTVEYLAKNVWLVGSPDTVADKINQFMGNYGEFGTLLSVAHDWVDPGPVLHSMELLAGEVRPAIQTY